MQKLDGKCIGSTGVMVTAKFARPVSQKSQTKLETLCLLSKIFFRALRIWWRSWAIGTTLFLPTGNHHGRVCQVFMWRLCSETRCIQFTLVQPKRCLLHVLATGVEMGICLETTWKRNSDGYPNNKKKFVAQLGCEVPSKPLHLPIQDLIRLVITLSLAVPSKLLLWKQACGISQSSLGIFQVLHLRIGLTKILFSNARGLNGKQTLLGLCNFLVFREKRMCSHQDFNLKLMSVCLWSLHAAIELMDYNDLILGSADAQVGPLVTQKFLIYFPQNTTCNM